jgi:hypothetical protein
LDYSANKDSFKRKKAIMQLSCIIAFLFDGYLTQQGLHVPNWLTINAFLFDGYLTPIC